MKYIWVLLISILGLAVTGFVLIKYFAPKGTIISSWFRTLNKTYQLTGGKLNFDWHNLGLAYDIVPASVETLNWAKKIFPSVIVERGNTIVPISQADHLHVAWINKKLGVLQG